MASTDADAFFRRSLVSVLTVIAVVATAACVADPVQNMAAEPSDIVDFELLERPGSPNHWLIAPNGVAPALNADAQAPEFPVEASALADAWGEVVRNQPRVSIIAVSDDGLQSEAEQRSALFGFVDRISFRAIPLGPGRSSYIAYSRSQAGYWDLGVNGRRLRDWGRMLEQALADAQPD